MTYQESLDYLYGLQKFGVKLGLENIRTFLSRLGHPENRFETVLVAGTNGKGSVAAALAGMLTTSGCRTGLYTSPHLHSFSERIRVDGLAIAENKIAELVADLQPHAGSVPLTFFEFTTALALVFFAEQKVDLAILEVGLGGRLDATNAVTPRLSIITPVSRDHEQHLGSGLDLIAREKAGIMRGSVPVLSARQEPVVQEALTQEAKQLGTSIMACPNEYKLTEHVETFDYHGFGLDLVALKPGIPGRHQFGNMATALAAAEILQQAGFPLTEETMRVGVETVFWPGRLEWMADHSVLLDGAHNGAGATELARYLADQRLDNVHWIVGMKADKNVREILTPLGAQVTAIYCVEPPVEEAVPVAILQSEAERLTGRVSSFSSLEDALRKARTEAGTQGVVLVAGSLFLVSAIRQLLLQEEGRPCDRSVS